MDTKEFNRLLKRIAFDSAALEKIYIFYYRRLVKYFSNIYGKEIAEDSVQKFFLELKDRVKNTNYIEYPTTWMFKCCDNVAKRETNKESRYTYLSKNIAVTIEHNLEIIYSGISNELKQLDKEAQKIIHLHHWEGYSLKEISKLFDTDYEVLRKNYQRIIKKLKKFLK